MQPRKPQRSDRRPCVLPNARAFKLSFAVEGILPLYKLYKNLYTHAHILLQLHDFGSMYVACIAPRAVRRPPFTIRRYSRFPLKKRDLSTYFTYPPTYLTYLPTLLST